MLSFDAGRWVHDLFCALTLMFSLKEEKVITLHMELCTLTFGDGESLISCSSNYGYQKKVQHSLFQRKMGQFMLRFA